jgi:aspartate-semialdehyde dehydrogenase
MTVQKCTPGLDCDFVLSSLPSDFAETVEVEIAKSGTPVISNAGSHRMKADVPLLIPEINPDHLDALTVQRQRIGSKGYIVDQSELHQHRTGVSAGGNPQKVRLEAVSVVTMQAISGRGYPGVASLDILDNILPAIDAGGEDHKVETEPLKLLGQWKNGTFVDAPIRMSAQTHRVMVRDGHSKQ